MNAARFFRDAVNRRIMADGISQAELARRSGVSQPHVNQMLRGTVVPSLDIAEKIAAAVGMPLSKLLAEPRQKKVG